jgi:hypothetical protein
MKSKNKVLIDNISTKELIYDSTARLDFYVKSNTEEDFVKLRIRIYDPFFNVNYMPYYYDITHNKLQDYVRYFVSFNLEKDVNFERLNYRGGIRVTFEDLDTSDIILDENLKFNFKIPEFRNRRTDGETIEDKRLWIIGDSNAWTTFGGFVEPTLQKIGKYIPVRYTHPGLSLYKFINGNYYGFLDVIPIKDDDVLVFYLGEIDLRYSLLKAYYTKKLDIDFLTNKLVFDYFEVLKKISNKYKNNKIIIFSPNPPCRDHYVKSELEQYVLGSEFLRLSCYKSFKTYCESYCSMNGRIKFLDWTDKYTDQDGLSLTSKFYPNDIHVKDYTNAVECLRNYIDKI